MAIIHHSFYDTRVIIRHMNRQNHQKTLVSLNYVAGSRIKRLQVETIFSEKQIFPIDLICVFQDNHRFTSSINIGTINPIWTYLIMP